MVVAADVVVDLEVIEVDEVAAEEAEEVCHSITEWHKTHMLTFLLFRWFRR